MLRRTRSRATVRICTRWPSTCRTAKARRPPRAASRRTNCVAFSPALHEAGYAKTSISRRMASVRSFITFGQREGWAKSNPAKALRNPRKSRKLPHFLTTDEVGKLLDAPKGNTPAAVRDRAILETLYSAGSARERIGRRSTTAIWISPPASSASAAKARRNGWPQSVLSLPVHSKRGWKSAHSRHAKRLAAKLRSSRTSSALG